MQIKKLRRLIYILLKFIFDWVMNIYFCQPGIGGLRKHVTCHAGEYWVSTNACKISGLFARKVSFLTDLVLTWNHQGPCLSYVRFELVGSIFLQENEICLMCLFHLRARSLLRGAM